MSLAYVMAHRDLHLAKADEAAEFLKAGGATAGEGYGTDLAGDDNVSFLSANLFAREMNAIQSRPNVNAGNS